MKRITIMVPYSWDDDRINTVKKQYEKEGYDVVIMGIPG